VTPVRLTVGHFLAQPFEIPAQPGRVNASGCAAGALHGRPQGRSEF
jgi:hypothetical protein